MSRRGEDGPGELADRPWVPAPRLPTLSPDPQPGRGADRRKAHRISAPKGQALRGDILVAGGLPVRMELLDVSYAGASVRFPKAELPECKRGDELRLCFRFGDHGRPILLRSVVRMLGEEGTRLRVRLMFLDAEKLDGLLAPSAWRSFNRRQSYRVGPRPGRRIDVAVGWRETRRIGMLADISATGMAVVMPWRGDESLPPGEKVALGIKLPSRAEPIFAVAVLVDVQESEGRTRWGLQFAPELTQGWPSKERAIVEYVMLRQREELQEKLDEEEGRTDRRSA